MDDPRAFEKRFLLTWLPWRGKGVRQRSEGGCSVVGERRMCEREDRWSDATLRYRFPRRCVHVRRCETAILNLTARVATRRWRWRPECERGARTAPPSNETPFCGRSAGVGGRGSILWPSRARCAPCSPSKTANTRTRPLASVCQLLN